MVLQQAQAMTSFRKHVLALLGENYNDKTLILCPTAFVKLLNGDHKAAILLAQILFWGEKTHDPEGWFYKSYADWKAETGLSEAQVRRIVHGDRRTQQPQVTLDDLGVETKLKKVRSTGAPTVHYRINQTKFLNALHTLTGQGDPRQCQDSIPNKVEDETLQMSGMNAQQSTASLDQDSKITSKDRSHEDQDHQNVDEDSDLALFYAYQNRFGKLNSPLKPALREQLVRLGEQQVRAVLERCSTRGRSFNYVLKALENEAATPSEAATETRWEGTQPFYGDEGLMPQQATETASLPVSERVQTPLKTGTALQVWAAAFHQMQQQLGSDFCNRMHGLTLVDFDGNIFVVVAKTTLMRNELEGRLARAVQRILGDVGGQGLGLQVLLEDEWCERYSAEGIALSA